MTTNQLFFAMAGLLLAMGSMFAGFFKYYIDAKIDPVASDVKRLIDYMILHEGKIARLEERTK
jgi:hypothetical protein